MVVCQLSLYPLRQSRVSPALDDCLAELRAAGLKAEVGTMSSYVEGDEDALFEGLRRAFRAAARHGDVVMVVTLSNACPA